MEKAEAVFVLDTENRSTLIKKIINNGLIPINKNEQFDAINTIKHNKFRAVIVNSNTISDDIIEFVLNVRDFQSDVPILVLGNALTPEEKKALKKMSNIFLHEIHENLIENLKSITSAKNKNIK